VENQISVLPGDAFKNLNKLKQVNLKRNACINFVFEGDELLVKLMAAVTDTCAVCDPNDDNPRLCEKLKKLANDFEKTREDFVAQLYKMSKDARIYQGNIESMDAKITQHASETEYDVKVKQVKLEKKFNDDMGELKRQVEELKKNSAANVFSSKACALMVVVWIIRSI
jgi:hypothetical protein